VTAFLGPNGAGKSSTLRILLGLDRPQAGAATFNGLPYKSLNQPLKLIGAVFDGIGGAPSRSVKSHFRMIANSNGIASSRLPEVLRLVGLEEKSNARLRTLSLGEGQRLSLAAAMLGEPTCLVLDEPTNGLDPGGLRWFRQLVRDQAGQGRTVLLSSHLLTEVEMVADDIVIINHGRVAAAGRLDDIRQQLESLENLFFDVTNG
ncbi:MAG: ATP-binding cassette domain-containing protein, partial [Propionibacteriaceae bacterium]|jgi:ABC-2 type transport system ATP-binding protein|nr:ATP-binding cassette domain-containing protein [Propionibacteriaceae bacterium]